MKHSLAAYPSRFLGYVVSQTKICLQYSEVTTKLRFKQGADYVKLHDTSKALPIKTTGTEVDILAVGCQMTEIEDMQKLLIQAYKDYGLINAKVYTETYNKDFVDFLLEIRRDLDATIDELESKKDRANERRC